MIVPSPTLTLEAADFSTALASLVEGPGVFLIIPREGDPYLSKTNVVRRRLLRLLDPAARSARFLSLTGVAERVELWRTSSRLEMMLLYFALAKSYFPQDYLKLTRLRYPAWVRLTLSNAFPRTMISSRLSERSGLSYGPFRTRAAAESFEKQLLDLFQLRRCHEDLEPSPEHPGCIYGEMLQCLRPCQEAVTTAEYGAETQRVRDFLGSQGQSLIESIAAARDRSSALLDFEEAARQHTRLEKTNAALRAVDDLATLSDQLSGVAVCRVEGNRSVRLFFCLQGLWHDPVDFSVVAAGSETESMDSRLRGILEAKQHAAKRTADREEHIALLARWYYSGLRDAEWIAFTPNEAPPWRRIVNAIARCVKGEPRLS
jgi:excinuclease ABC subunit C